jgi:uncharacterized DUF497 family protein
MLVEWDEKKRTSNLEDHGVDFIDAAPIFGNVVVEAEDKRNDYGERRFRALGHVGDDYFMVTYTWRGNARRIVSAWRGDDDGKRRYQAILARNPER